MSDAREPDVEALDPEPPEPNRYLTTRARLTALEQRLGRWGQGLRAGVRRQNWFAAGVQFVIVVCGIIIGFQVTAWGNAQADRAKEAAYLGQLEDELEATLVLIDEEEAYDRPANRATLRLVRSFYELESPPVDSFLVWYNDALGASTPKPPLGTAEALITTGDLRLIRNAALRSAIARYIEEMRGLQVSHLEVEHKWRRATDQVDSHIDQARLLDALLTEEDWAMLTPDDWEWGIPPKPRRNPFPFDLATFLETRSAFDAVYLMSYCRADMKDLRLLMRDAAADLLERVEQEQQR